MSNFKVYQCVCLKTISRKRQRRPGHLKEDLWYHLIGLNIYFKGRCILCQVRRRRYHTRSWYLNKIYFNYSHSPEENTIVRNESLIHLILFNEYLLGDKSKRINANDYFIYIHFGGPNSAMRNTTVIVFYWQNRSWLIQGNAPLKWCKTFFFSL